jgi:hypothetical protein
MGALMQLVAYGAQDTYLTGTPSVTFFQAVYQQSTNFAMEVIQQTVNGTATNSAQVSVIVARNGDLLGQMEITLAPLLNNVLTSNSNAYDTNYIAERAISTVTLNIGGQQIDKHYQTWWRLYSELFLTSADKAKYNKMVSSIAPVTSAGSGSTPYRVHLPLLFFFNRNPGLFLPLVSLQYAEVRLDFVLSPYYSSYFDSTFEVWGNYVYLDTNERTQFASQPNQYLIEQLQTSNGDTITTVGETSPQLVRLNFNHPVKELVWCYQVPNATTAGNLNGMWNFSTNPSNVNVTLDPRITFSTNTLTSSDMLGVPKVFAGSNVIVDAAMGYVQNGVYKSWTEEGKANSASNGYEVGPLHQFKVVLNGQDRFKEQYGRYFNQVQPYYYHSGNPQPGVYSYSFALQPEEFQPTGTCNFSRIDNAQVFVALKTGSQSTIQKLFAVNYNILNVASGMAGLAFSS